MANQCWATNSGGKWLWNDGGCILLNEQVGIIKDGDFTTAYLRRLDKPKQRFQFTTSITVIARIALIRRLRTTSRILKTLVVKTKQAFLSKRDAKIIKLKKLWSAYREMFDV